MTSPTTLIEFNNSTDSVIYITFTKVTDEFPSSLTVWPANSSMIPTFSYVAYTEEIPAFEIKSTAQDLNPFATPSSDFMTSILFVWSDNNNQSKNGNSYYVDMKNETVTLIDNSGPNPFTITLTKSLDSVENTVFTFNVSPLN